MAKPVYRIETERSGSNVYTITDEGVNLRVKSIATDTLGNFSFVLPSVNGLDTKYSDLHLFDKVKIWLGWDSINVSNDPLLVGRIENIESGGDSKSGFFRKVVGHDEGEVLLRRLKINRRWSGSPDTSAKASEIINILADELGISKNVDVDDTYLTQTIGTETYWDVIRNFSDFWASADVQLKKDFYFKNVGGNNTLFWKNRPVRTDGVETIVEGENLLFYRKIEDVPSVKNRIWVFGKQDRKYPSDGDVLTEASLDYWTSDYTLTLHDSAYHCGTHSVMVSHVTTQADEMLTAICLPSEMIRVKDAGTLNFHMLEGGSGGTSITAMNIKLYAPNVINRFQRNFTTFPNFGSFTEYIVGVGSKYEVASGNDGWIREIGKPSWYDIYNIEFNVTFDNVATSTIAFLVDCLYFDNLRWTSFAQDSGEGSSQALYDIRDLEYTSETLHSNNECFARAKTLLYQLKNPITQLTCKLNGNTNVLVGDRIPITLSREGYSAKNFDVLNVEHVLDQGFHTFVTMTDSVDTRKPSESTNQVAILRGIKRDIADLNKQIQNIR